MTLILICVLAFVSVHRFRHAVRKKSRFIINILISFLMIYALSRIIFEDSEKDATEVLYEDIHVNLIHHHPRNEKILVFYNRYKDKVRFKPLIDKIGAKQVDEVFMEKFYVFSNPEKMSKIIKDKGGHYDMLLITYMMNDKQGLLTIDKSQFDFVSVLTKSFPFGMESWFAEKKCLAISISAPDPSNEAKVAFEMAVHCYDHNNYMSWKEAEEEILNASPAGVVGDE